MSNRRAMIFTLGGWDVDALAFILAHETSTGLTMGSVQKTAINNCYKRYKNVIPTPNGSNLWSLLGPFTRIWRFCPINDSTANAAAYNIDFVSKTAYGTFTNFVSGDFSPNGVTSGATKYFSNILTPNTYALNSVGHYAYIRSYPSGSSSIMGANDSGNVNRTGLLSDLASGFRSYINNTAVTTAAAVIPTRLIGTQRGSSTTLESVKDGVVVKTEAIASTAKTTRNFYWFARNNNGGLGNEYSGGQIASIYQGMPYLTANELSDFYWIEQLYQTEVITGGRQV